MTYHLLLLIFSLTGSQAVFTVAATSSTNTSTTVNSTFHLSLPHYENTDSLCYYFLSTTSHLADCLTRMEALYRINETSSANATCNALYGAVRCFHFVACRQCKETFDGVHWDGAKWQMEMFAKIQAERCPSVRPPEVLPDCPAVAAVQGRLHVQLLEETEDDRSMTTEIKSRAYIYVFIFVVIIISILLVWSIVTLMCKLSDGLKLPVDPKMIGCLSKDRSVGSSSRGRGGKEDPDVLEVKTSGDVVQPVGLPAGKSMKLKKPVHAKLTKSSGRLQPKTAAATAASKKSIKKSQSISRRPKKGGRAPTAGPPKTYQTGFTSALSSAASD